MPCLVVGSGRHAILHLLAGDGRERKIARDVLSIHPAAELFPMMTADELKALGTDIKKNGLREGVSMFEGALLDGRNRLDAMELAGIKLVTGNGQIEWANIQCRDVGRVDPVTFVISKNIHRRHLTPEDKRDFIAKLVTAAPEKSNRQIAEMAKVDHKIVASVRAKKEARGKFPTSKPAPTRKAESNRPTSRRSRTTLP
ncbi:MAG TPA: hypothetical protein VKB78_08025 [Pirellulales bacterium]|nr:hypothetical protein [Pirellulales bacterium]